MTERKPDEGEILEEIERRALFDMDDEADDEELDVVGTLSPAANGTAAEPAADLTLGGYIAKHDRVPAFEGCDGQPYTVDLAYDETGDPERPVAAFLVFVRWAATGAGIMDHVESGDVASGRTEKDAERAAHDLTLYEVKAELDAAIIRKQDELRD